MVHSGQYMIFIPIITMEQVLQRKLLMMISLRIKMRMTDDDDDHDDDA